MVATGADWSTRGKRKDEYIDAMRTLWGDDAAEFDGETVKFKDAYLYPTPVRNRQVPILVGGTTDVALKRAARRGDGWVSFLKTEDGAERINKFREFAREAGRDPSKLRTVAAIFSWTTEDELKMYRDAGYDEFQIYVCGELSLDDAKLNDELAGLSRKFVDLVRDW
jgi:alkanesulfonate monooxygenase SsuD/methylene tetrahydromethanopterin reductase-like flavin-dependent oxidoreductase (luciferase family)